MKKHLFFAVGLSSLLASTLSAEQANCQGSCAPKAQAKYCSTKECADNSHETKSHDTSAKPKTAAQNNSIKMIDTKGLQAIINSKTPVIILDARTAQYDDGKRIPGAKSLPFTASNDQINQLVPNKDALIVVYCANPKCPASHNLADKLMTLGYTNIQEYPEGIDGWVSSGNKTEQQTRR